MSPSSQTSEVSESHSWFPNHDRVRLSILLLRYHLPSFFREEGIWGLTKGWAPTLIGYSLQGLGKFGFYEVFKNLYGGALGEENAYVYRTTLYLLASASAEFFADIALAPWEATKVRIQTQDNWASSLRQGLPKLYGKIKRCNTCWTIPELFRFSSS
jgi:hypothetical protein